VALGVGDDEAEGGEEQDVEEVEEEVGEVDPGPEPAPLVVEEAGHQRVAQELAAIVVHHNAEDMVPLVILPGLPLILQWWG
jgi:hypothetical protein